MDAVNHTPTPARRARLSLLPFLLTLLAAAWLLAPPLAAAQPAEDQTEAAAEANLQFNLGVAAFRKADFEQALSHFFISNRLAPNPRLFLNIALCYEQLNKYVEAYRYYDAFATTNDDPTKAQAIQDAMARVKPQVSLLYIESTPPGATIFINRRELGSYGVTPRTVAVAPGDYQVILDLKGYQPFQSASVNLSLGAEQKVSGDLPRILGQLQLSGTPEGATVEVDDATGVVTGALPAQLDLTPGEHVARVKSPGFKTRELIITVKPEQSLSLSVELERQTGVLVVESEERDAQILLDGNIVGFTPAVIDSVPVGEHKVVVQSSGFKPFEVSITIEPDTRQVLDARLGFSEDVAAASRVNESVSDAPASVSLISRREIEAMGYWNVADALQGTRGFYLTNDGVYQFAGVRGSSHLNQYSNRLQVLIDGHTMNDSWIGQSFVDFTLMTNLYDIEQIEVVRGPSSVLYGTSAFLGVVNIITPSPKEASARFGISAAGDGIWRAQATMGAPLGKDGKDGSIWVAGGGLVGQGQALSIKGARDDSANPIGDISADAVSALQAGNAMLRARWHDFTAQGYFSQREKGLDNTAYNTVLGDADSILTERRAYGEVRYEPKINDVLGLVARLYYDHFRYEGTFDYNSTSNGVELFTGHWVGTELRALLNFAKSTRLSIGAEYQYHLVNNATGRDFNVGQYLNESLPYHQVSTSVIADSAPLSWLRLSAGLRFDAWYIQGLPTTSDGSVRDDRFFSSISPRLALIFKPSTDDTVKLMGGRAFRAPSINEMTYNDAGTTQVVSPNLNPETIWTGELEYTRNLPSDFILTTSAFVNIIQDFIAENGEGSQTDPLFYANRTDEQIYTLGAEVEVRRFFKRGWMLAAQTGLQSTRIGDTDFFQGVEAINSPMSTSSLKLVVPIVQRFVRFGTRLTFETGRRDTTDKMTDPALLWDATFSGEDQVLGLRYSVGVRNLLGWKYNQPQVFLNPATSPSARTFTLDISYNY